MKRRGVHVGAIAGAVTVIGCYAIETIYKITIPAPVSSSVTVLVMYLISFLIPDKYEVDLQEGESVAPQKE